MLNLFFRLPAIAGFALWVTIIFCLPETLRARVGSGEIYRGKSRSWIIWPPRLIAEPVPEEKRGPPPPKPTLLGYWRLFKYPPIGIVSCDTAILYSSYFCIAVELPTALENTYHWSSAEVGAGYLVVGFAMVIGSILGGRFSDWRRKMLVKETGEEEVAPENRLNDQVWGIFLIAGGLVMFGWFVDKKIHPVATLISTFLSPSSPLI